MTIKDIHRVTAVPFHTPTGAWLMIYEYNDPVSAGGQIKISIMVNGSLGSVDKTTARGVNVRAGQTAPIMVMINPNVMNQL
ncbi:hypothetical protein RMR21_006105 [Agrobacterium sp. rho-8.1]|nr:hypothetical protein [Agrobacterium sp. rho-8.1]